MRARRVLLFSCAALLNLGMVGMTPCHADVVLDCNTISSDSPRLSANPAQPPQGLSPNAWGKITNQVRASRYDLVRRAGTDDRVVEVDGVLDTADAGYAVWVATHPNLNLEYEFDKRGMRVQPRGAGQDAWNWGLELVGLGGEYGLQAAGPVPPHVERNRVEYRRPGLLEWYTHDRRGVEQGFTIESVPTGATGRMRVEFTVSGTLAAELTSSGEGVTLIDAEGETALRYDQLYAFDAAGRDLPVWMELREDGGPASHLALWVDIRGADFPVTIDPLISTQVAKMTAADAAAGDEFGASVSINGDTVVVGASGDDGAGESSGSAYIFDRNAGGADNWGEVAKLTASDAAAGVQFGSSVSISGDRVVIGARFHSGVSFEAGSAYVFERNSGGLDNWGEVAQLAASDSAAADLFGWSVSISGETVIVGAKGDDDAGGDSGSAYVYGRNAGGLDSWGEVAKLVASDAAPGDEFGWSVSIAGDEVVVGAPSDDDGGDVSGSAYVYGRNVGGLDNWGEVAKLTASDAATLDLFGLSVSISGDTVIVGAPGDDGVAPDSGSAYVYGRDTGGANSWGEVAKVRALREAGLDQFGWSVSISGDMVVVGAIGDDGAGVDSGAAYMFGRHLGGTSAWGQLGKVTPLDAAAGDFFGFSVSISGDMVVAGANLDDDAGADSGSAYTFTASGCAWQKFAQPVAADAAAGDHFGSSVSTSGDTVVVGAVYDGDAGVHSGSAYVYQRNVGGAEMWGQVAKLTASDAAAEDHFGSSVSISGDMVVVGASGGDDAGVNSGSAYVYQRNAGGAEMWGQVAKLTASDAAAGDVFGVSVSISGDTVVVGAMYEGLHSGSAYVYQRNVGGAEMWGQVIKLTASDRRVDDVFGWSVSISGETVIVGAKGNSDAGGSSGSAYVFGRNAGGADNWGEVEKLTASDAAAGDLFGYSVSISGDTVVVGANRGGSGPRGSAYVYERNAGGANNWVEVTELTAVDVVPEDRFGVSVSISGDTIIVGAFLSDGVGTADSGAAYIFERNANGADNWGEVAKMTPRYVASWDWFGGSVSISGSTVVVGASLNDYLGADAGASFVFEFSCIACGDGLLEPPEQCDNGDDNSDVIPDSCRTDCRLPACSDFSLDTGEDCDDGNLVDDDGCDSNCTFTGCGNGVVTSLEECDDGAGNSDVVPDACRTDCTLPACGDLVLDTGEDCDDGNLTDNDGCDSNCTVTACGNGIVTSPEECDDGNTAPGDRCDGLCLWECSDTDGDGIGVLGAECDGGAEPDCDDGDSQIWRAPGEAMDVLFTGPMSLIWEPPVYFGSVLVSYDVLRSQDSKSFSAASATCVESDDGSDTMATDTAIPNPNSVFYYLIRAENACPVVGQGPVGTQSDGTLRIGRSCP